LFSDNPFESQHSARTFALSSAINANTYQSLDS